MVRGGGCYPNVKLYSKLPSFIGLILQERFKGVRVKIKESGWTGGREQRTFGDKTKDSDNSVYPPNQGKITPDLLFLFSGNSNSRSNGESVNHCFADSLTIFVEGGSPSIPEGVPRRTRQSVVEVGCQWGRSKVTIVSVGPVLLNFTITMYPTYFFVHLGDTFTIFFGRICAGPYWEGIYFWNLLIGCEMGDPRRAKKKSHDL